MQLGRVVGTVVSTAKERSLEGRKLLVVRIVDLDAKETGAYVVAIDAVDAGVGDVVIVASGSSARLTEATKDRPADAVIMAIVDSWDVAGKTKYRKSDD
ncbi:MAG TPA: EutN/CcmL family microcompartment protein [Candidatus Hydrogenedentes bacterium]|nr:EutN/CcmL family microcompartment protein [Candidatus Hydrogenedentota bacterium]HOS02599.1 EutN/CcmL family microcompartment protein [Candidatus Hydrogenedentota bacterium]